MLRFVLMLVIMFLGSGVMLAQEAAELDKAHSSITFTAEHIVVTDGSDDAASTYYTVGKTNGRFQDFAIEFVPAEKFTESKISAKVFAKSIDTDNGPRDAHLRSQAFFDSEIYPLIMFKSSSITQNDQGKYEITGKLTIKGISKEVVFTAESGSPVPYDNGRTYTSFKATTRINRLDYNLKWNELLENGAFRVSNYVEITIQANFLLNEDS